MGSIMRYEVYYSYNGKKILRKTVDDYYTVDSEDVCEVSEEVPVGFVSKKLAEKLIELAEKKDKEEWMKSDFEDYAKYALGTDIIIPFPPEIIKNFYSYKDMKFQVSPDGKRLAVYGVTRSSISEEDYLQGKHLSKEKREGDD